MPDETITKEKADAFLALDNRGQASISPTRRRTIDGVRMTELLALQTEVSTLREALETANAEIRRLKETWQDRIEDEVRLRMRGYGRT